MKILPLSIFWVLFLYQHAAAQSEEAAIRQVIEAESKTYHFNADRTAFLAYWHVTPDSRMVYSEPAITVLLGSEQLSPTNPQLLQSKPDFAVNTYTNVVIKANGTVAWATLDQKSELPDGTISYYHEFRGMEKVEGAWKIMNSSVQKYKP
jgi:hypothetical protein